MPNSKPRVYLPTNPKGKLDLAAKVYAKHTQLGATSPLNTMQNHTWTSNGPEVANALTLHDQAESLKRQADEAYKKRDLLLAEIDESLKSSRDLLLSITRDNPKELGQWGFDVFDSPKAAPKKQV